MRPEFLFVVFALVAGAVAVYSFARIKQRREDAATAAQRLGLTYHQDDIHGIAALPHPVFRLGDSRTVSNVVQGTYADREVALFDYVYVESHTDAEGHDTSTTYPFSGVLVHLSIDSPSTVVRREKVTTKFANALGMGRDIQFESDEFNRSFEVRSDSQGFAFTLIDTAMMEWLQSNAQDLDLQFEQSALIAIARRRPWVEMDEILERVIEFVARFPRLVWTEYGKSV